MNATYLRLLRAQTAAFDQLDRIGSVICTCGHEFRQHTEHSGCSHINEPAVLFNERRVNYCTCEEFVARDEINAVIVAARVI